ELKGRSPRTRNTCAERGSISIDNLMGQTSWQFLLIVGLSVLTSNLVLNQVNA
ncbi:hypothetical protein M8J76_015275, partial [Diaphorina citri]